MTFPKTMKRLETVLNSLTHAQREALRLVRLEDDGKRTQAEIADSLGISLASLRDRLNGALKKITDEFSEWNPSDQERPAYWSGLFLPKNSLYWGLYQKSEAKKVYPVYKLSHESFKRLFQIEMSIIRPKVRTPNPGIQKKKEWDRITSYRPSHDGVLSPMLAHLANAYHSEAEKKRKKNKLQHFKFVTTDPKTAFEQVRAAEKEEKLRLKNKRIDEDEF